ncbi:uncharacterized protein LOC107030364 [Solanum pennellii]|uniref:Uncharacterized protein LOC107030364 n=1 Tax=Solanum pennellii TaxID=28526 RepID=A0ABM1HL86_SOLPN|nr:uncharacterized protein LOC107030364 [Solanum pennellii]
MYKVQDKPRFKKRFSNQGSSRAPRANKSNVPTPNPQEGKGSGSYVDRHLCSKCGRRHEGKCLVGSGNCYSCGKSGHIKIDCPMMRIQGRANSQDQESAPNPYTPKKNRFYALQYRSDQEISSDAVTDMLKLFFLDLYALLDPGATLSFPPLAMKFDILTQWMIS